MIFPITGTRCSFEQENGSFLGGYSFLGPVNYKADSLMMIEEDRNTPFHSILEIALDRILFHYDK